MAFQKDDAASSITPQALVEVCFCHHARRTARAITRLYDDGFQPLRLKASQFNILAMIAAHEASSAAEISRHLAMDRTTLSRNLKPLRELGYLTATGGAGRRPDALELTDAGRTLLNQATVLWQSVQSELTQRLGAGQAGLLLQNLEAAARAVA